MKQDEFCLVTHVLIMKYLSKLLNLDIVATKYVFMLSLVWFLGAFHVLNSVFIMEPDNSGNIRSEDTVKGTFDASQSLIDWAKMSIFIGWLFGSSLLSTLSDMRGRKFAYVFATVVMLTGCLLQIFAWSINVFIIGRAVMGFGLGGAGVISYVWGCEWMITSSIQKHKKDAGADLTLCTTDVSEQDVVIDQLDASEQCDDECEVYEYNTTGSSLFQITWSLGGAICAFVAFLVPDWRHLMAVCSICTLIPVVIIILNVPESPRWLLANRKQDGYHEIMEHSYGTYPSISLVDDKNDEIILEKPSLKLFLRPPLLTLILGLSYIWFSNAFVYYGMLLNANHLPGNVFVISCLMNLLGVPGQILAIPCEKRFGLLRSFIIAMFSCFVTFSLMAAIVLLFKNTLLVVLISTLSIIGTFICSLQFSLCYMVSFNSFETSIRNTGVGIGVTMGRFGAMICPLVVSLGMKSDSSIGYPALLVFAAVIGTSCFISKLVIPL